MDALLKRIFAPLVKKGPKAILGAGEGLREAMFEWWTVMPDDKPYALEQIEKHERRARTATRRDAAGTQRLRVRAAPRLPG